MYRIVIVWTDGTTRTGAYFATDDTARSEGQEFVEESSKDPVFVGIIQDGELIASWTKTGSQPLYLPALAGR